MYRLRDQVLEKSRLRSGELVRAFGIGTQDPRGGPTDDVLRSLLPKECQHHGSKGTNQSRWESLRYAKPRTIGMRRHAMSIRCDIQHRDLLRRYNDQNSQSLAFHSHELP